MNKTHEEIIDVCKSEGATQGVIGGGMVGLAIGVLPVAVAYSLDTGNSALTTIHSTSTYTDLLGNSATLEGSPSEANPSVH